MKHKPNCSSNIRCAVYHENGVCPHPKKCDCGADRVSTPPQEEWEKELDKGWELWNYFHKHGTYTTCGEEVKSFIRSLLSKARAEAKKEAEECFQESLDGMVMKLEDARKEEREKVIKWAEERLSPDDDVLREQSKEWCGGWNSALLNLLNYLKSK